MRSVVQRVNQAQLSVIEDAGARTHASIGRGLVVLAGIETDDTADDVAWTARKVAGLRVFEDDAGKMNLALPDAARSWDAAGGPPSADTPPHGVLLVPNFTVAGRAHKGRRPDFTTAKHPSEAAPMFDALAHALREQLPGQAVVTGVFGAHMHVDLSNDGPVTIWLDSRA